MGWRSRMCSLLCSCKKSDDDVDVRPRMGPVHLPLPVDWHQASCRGLGEACTICGDIRKVATHVARPCGHSACGECWARAKKGMETTTSEGERKHRCMFCNVTLEDGDILKAPPEILTCYSEPDAGGGERLDEMLDSALHQMVDSKQQMGEVQCRLEELLRELESLPDDQDARDSVMQVESSCLLELLQQMDVLVESTRCFAPIEQITQEVQAVVNEQANKELKQRHDGMSKGNDDGYVAFNWARVYRSQWNVTRQVGLRVLQELLPTATALVVENSPQDLSLCLVTAMSGLEAKLTVSAHEIERKMQKLELALGCCVKTMQFQAPASCVANPLACRCELDQMSPTQFSEESTTKIQAKVASNSQEQHTSMLPQH